MRTPVPSIVFSCLVASTAWSPAFAQARDIIEGKYCGTAWSGGELVEIVTTLTTQANGLLAGSYEFADHGEDTPGTLREYLKQADDTRTLIWIDKYGTGRLIVHFNQSRKSFTGNWGVYTEDPSYRWDGGPCDPDVAGL